MNLSNGTCVRYNNVDSISNKDPDQFFFSPSDGPDSDDDGSDLGDSGGLFSACRFSYT
jgi:hypothetical protein